MWKNNIFILSNKRLYMFIFTKCLFHSYLFLEEKVCWFCSCVNLNDKMKSQKWNDFSHEWQSFAFFSSSTSDNKNWLYYNERNIKLQPAADFNWELNLKYPISLNHCVWHKMSSNFCSEISQKIWMECHKAKEEDGNKHCDCKCYSGQFSC